MYFVGKLITIIYCSLIIEYTIQYILLRNTYFTGLLKQHMENLL